MRRRCGRCGSLGISRYEPRVRSDVRGRWWDDGVQKREGRRALPSCPLYCASYPATSAQGHGTGPGSQQLAIHEDSRIPPAVSSHLLRWVLVPPPSTPAERQMQGLASSDIAGPVLYEVYHFHGDPIKGAADVARCRRGLSTWLDGRFERSRDGISLSSRRWCRTRSITSMHPRTIHIEEDMWSWTSFPLLLASSCPPSTSNSMHRCPNIEHTHAYRPP